MKSVLITGASSGIGRAIALKLAEEGDSIYITGRDEEKLKDVVSNIQDKGGQGYYAVADVRESDLAREVVKDAIEKMGDLSVLIANAGIGRFKHLEEFSDGDFDIQFDTNVKGVFNYLRPVIRYMRKSNRGQIIVTSSNLGLNTSARCGVYAATKHAIQAMIGALRDELQGTMIKAATLNPGSVDTPWYDGKDVDRSKMLDVNDVVDAAMLLIHQGKRSDIDHILIRPSQE